MISRAALALVLPGMITSGSVWAEPLIQSGSYEITYRLELPHLERWAIEKTATTCVSEPRGIGSAILPILSDNNPFTGCTVEDLQQDDIRLTYGIACSGRGSAKAQATYTFAPGGFSARIAMTMGAKNMTMTEVQTGRRIGDCNLASTGRNCESPGSNDMPVLQPRSRPQAIERLALVNADEQAGPVVEPRVGTPSRYASPAVSSLPMKTHEWPP